MVGRPPLSRAQPGFTLPVFERLAPPPPPDLVAARIEAATGPGDIVADLHGRGGWIARGAIDRQRRAFSFESSPLTRLLAEVVLRPPDLRHLDAAFSTLSASPRGDSSLKLAIGDMFATRCATCGRTVVCDELLWSAVDPATREPLPEPVPIEKHYRCTLCRDQQGGREQRRAEPDPADIERARRDVGGAAVRRALGERFPVPEGGEDLVRAVLALHTDRQIVGLAAILERIEGDLRASAVESGLRLAFLHAVLPAGRLASGPARIPGLRIAGGTVRTQVPDPWRERNPWLAFEEAYRGVRSFVQRLESGAIGPLEARMGTDLRSLVEGPATAVLRVATPTGLATLRAEADAASRDASAARVRPRVRLVLGQPPARFSQERLALAWHGTAWALGREAANLLPLEPLLGPAIRAPWSWQATALRRSLEAVAPHLARDGRAVLILESGGPEALVAAVLGGVGAGWRVVEARLSEPEEEAGGTVELVPPGGLLPPGPRSRANLRLEPEPGGMGDPGYVAGHGLFAAPERADARPFSPAEASRSVTDTAVEVLRARGEPARYERLLGEILVGLDRTGQLRRLVAAEASPDHEDRSAADADRSAADGDDRSAPDGRGGSAARRGAATPIPSAPIPSDHAAAGGPPTTGPEASAQRPGIPRTQAATSRHPERSVDPVDRVLALIRDEMSRPGQRRLAEIEPGRWWLADRADRQQASMPLADRVEWAVYSLLSTAGPISESAFFDRIASLFVGHDLPDEELVRACLASYRSPASTSDGLVTSEDVRRRTHEQTALLAQLAEGGHRLGMSVWVGRREQGRHLPDGRLLASWLEPREREVHLPSIVRGREEDVESVDCFWYVRARATIAFELEWTAMLGDVLLRRHAGIPPDDRLVRILALAPERAALARHKLEASPLLRAAIDEGDWHLILWPHLRAWLARESFDLASLEPYLGLEPPIERRGEQLGLFDPPETVR